MCPVTWLYYPARIIKRDPGTRSISNPGRGDLGVEMSGYEQRLSDSGQV